jgi:hypothetical protein
VRARSSDVYYYIVFYIIIGHRGNKIQILLDIDDCFFANFFFEINCPSKWGRQIPPPAPPREISSRYNFDQSFRSGSEEKATNISCRPLPNTNVMMHANVDINF